MSTQELIDSASRAIRPCPFCGKTPRVTYKNGDWGYTNDKVQIICCVVKISRDTEKWEQGRGTFSIIDDATRKLVKQWNTRAGD